MNVVVQFTTLRPHHLLLLCLALVVVGCDPDVLAVGTSSIDMDAGVDALGRSEALTGCARPEAGCPCDAERPVQCTREPLATPEGLVCIEGVRSCVGGLWSACESVREFTITYSPGALIAPPTECNPCNPACHSSVDRPTEGDATPENSEDVVYDPAEGGITIIQTEGGTSELEDRDGDGVPDVADDFPSDPTRSTTGIYQTLPFGGPAVYEPLELTARITTADVYFLMDTTGSMGGEINNLRAGLTTGTFLPGCGGGVIGALRCTIPNTWFGVGHFEDYPNAPYGSGAAGDTPQVHDLDLTSSIAEAQMAVNGLRTRNGADWPESHTQALWSTATGLGLRGFTPDRTDCPADTWGYPCFRADTIPIVVLFTDATMHNGTISANDYGGEPLYSTTPACRSDVCGLDPYCCAVEWDGICNSIASGRATCPAGAAFGRTWTETIDALNANGIKTIVVESSGGFSNGRADALGLANSTGTVGASGNPLVFSIPTNGSGLTTAVVDAIDELANATRFDLSARPADNPGTAFDETELVTSILAAGFGPGDCSSLVGPSALQCTPGTEVDFVVEFQNGVVEPSAVPQVFNFFIEILLDGAMQDRVPVRIVVPPLDSVFLPEGRYGRTHAATERCEIPPERPDWGVFAWEARTPADTLIRFEFRTADTEAGLDAAIPVSISVPARPENGSVDVAALLLANGQSNLRPFLRTTAVLLSSPDGRRSPVLSRFEQIYTCVAVE